MPYPDCVHGTCNKPHECNCEPGWYGPICNETVENRGKRAPSISTPHKFDTFLQTGTGATGANGVSAVAAVLAAGATVSGIATTPPLWETAPTAPTTGASALRRRTATRTSPVASIRPHSSIRNSLPCISTTTPPPLLMRRLG